MKTQLFPPVMNTTEMIHFPPNRGLFFNVNASILFRFYVRFFRKKDSGTYLLIKFINIVFKNIHLTVNRLPSRMFETIQFPPNGGVTKH